MLIKPINQGETLAAEIRLAKKEGAVNEFDIWWLGQSGFLIQWNKQCLLFDPYLSDSLTKKYASTNQPHDRMGELVITPELLDCIDIVTSSHHHTDHLDADTLIPLLKVNPTIRFVIPEANRSLVAERIKCAIDFPIGLTDGEEKKIDGFNFFGVPSAHDTIERDEQGRCKFMGYVVTFGKFNLYHSGDTRWYDQLPDLLAPFHVDVAFLPINGYDPDRGVAGNLNSVEAALLGKKIGAKLVIPHHFDMFAFNTGDPLTFATEAHELEQPYHILELGERLTLG
jgi:L-ascorbate metabolism protein UlaG (beta-lactamase superfamily)